MLKYFHLISCLLQYLSQFRIIRLQSFNIFGVLFVERTLLVKTVKLSAFIFVLYISSQFTLLHQLVLTLDSSHHIGVGPIPIHLLLEFYVDTFGVFAVFLPEYLGSSPLQFQFLLEVVDLLLQTHVLLV